MSAGDADGDGAADFLIGAPGADSGGSEAGAVYLVLGDASGSIDQSSCDARFIGDASGDGAGEYGIAGGGDVDGDGLGDILIGVRNNDASGSFEGAAYLLGPRL